MNDKTNEMLKECRQGGDFGQLVREAPLEVAWDIRMTQKTHGIYPDILKHLKTPHLLLQGKDNVFIMNEKLSWTHCENTFAIVT